MFFHTIKKKSNTTHPVKVNPLVNVGKTDLVSVSSPQDLVQHRFILFKQYLRKCIIRPMAKRTWQISSLCDCESDVQHKKSYCTFETILKKEHHLGQNGPTDPSLVSTSLTHNTSTSATIPTCLLCTTVVTSVCTAASITLGARCSCGGCEGGWGGGCWGWGVGWGPGWAAVGCATYCAAAAAANWSMMPGGRGPVSNTIESVTVIRLPLHN